MEKITVKTYIKNTVPDVWMHLTKPEHITHWNFASDTWECPKAENDLQVGGRFSYTMSSKDGLMSFDFCGEYTNIVLNHTIEYTLLDGRKVSIFLEQVEGGVELTEVFEPENQNTLELQQNGWQAILDNLKKYAEAH